MASLIHNWGNEMAFACILFSFSICLSPFLFFTFSQLVHHNLRFRTWLSSEFVWFSFWNYTSLSFYLYTHKWNGSEHKEKKNHWKRPNLLLTRKNRKSKGREIEKKMKCILQAINDSKWVKIKKENKIEIWNQSSLEI